VPQPSLPAAVAAATEAAEEEQDDQDRGDAHRRPEDCLTIGLALTPPPVCASVEGVLVRSPDASVLTLAVAVAPHARPLLRAVAASCVVAADELWLR
jgi:hypothetical protein